MGKDLIYREDALRACRPVIATGDDGVGTIGLTYDDINLLPAAHVESRERGRWEHAPIGYECSCCGIWISDRIVHDLIIDNADLSFCPSCGADMRGERDE